MTSDSQNVSIESTSASQQSSANDVDARGKLDVYIPKAPPLPGNRPVASNETEDIEDMLGYLD